MHGLHKATGYYNTLEAWRDWDAMVKKALNVPVHELNKIAPKPGTGWKTVDKSIGKLRELIEKHQSNPSRHGADADKREAKIGA